MQKADGSLALILLNIFTVAERASHRTRFTDRLNVLVWALPAPRKAKAVLSRIVYQNPPMPVSTALLVLGTLDGAGVETVVMGGWGIDALVGEQQRPHRDLDLILDQGDLGDALAALHDLGFQEWFRNPAPVPFGEHGIEGNVVVMRDAAMRVVDLHPMCLAALGGASVATGSIAGREVRCVSASLQIEAHTGNQIRSRRERRRHESNLRTAQRALAAGNANRDGLYSGTLAKQRSELV
jgi:lincosamide nucleotidyltransferase A/C/D/E